MAAAAAATPAAVVEHYFSLHTPEERAKKVLEATETVFRAKFRADVQVKAATSRYQLNCAVSAVGGAVIELEGVLSGIRELHAQCPGATVTDLNIDLNLHCLTLSITHSPAPGAGLASRLKSGVKRKGSTVDSDEEDDDGDNEGPKRRRLTGDAKGKSGATGSRVQALARKAELLCGECETPVDSKCEVVSSTDLRVTGLRRIRLPQLQKFFVKFSEYVRRYHAGQTPRCGIDLSHSTLKFDTTKAAAAAAAAAK